MRNHYLLYIALPDGEEGEFELIGDSNSVFPSMWSVLFAKSESAGEELCVVFGGKPGQLLVEDANSAAVRMEALCKFLCPILDSLARGSREISYHDVSRYLRSVVDHLHQRIAAWTFPDTCAPVFAVGFDEASVPTGTSAEEFVVARARECAAEWNAVQRAIDSSSVSDVCRHLGVDDPIASSMEWKSWAGRFGLALFKHHYFYSAFRQPRREAFADFDYDPLSSEDDLGNGRFRFKDAGRWGVEFRHSEERVVVVAPEWDRVLRAEAGVCNLVWLERNRRFGLATLAEGGRILREPFCDEAWPFHDGVAVVRVDSKMGYLCSDGSWLIEPQWDEAWEFSHGLAVVSTGEKLTYIDRGGHMLLPPMFDEAGSFTSFGLARVRCGDLYGLLRHDGIYALDMEYRALEWHEDLQAWSASREGECLLVRMDGSPWLRGAFEKYSLCAGGRFITAHAAERVALFGWNGDLLFECAGTHLKFLNSDRCLFMLTNAGTTTLLDERGKAVLPASYLQVAEFESVHNSVRVTCKYGGKPLHGVWDLSLAKEVVPCRYDVIWTVPLPGWPQEYGYFVATKTHVSSDARGLAYRVGILRADGSLLVPDRYAWIGDSIALGRSNARSHICSAIEFAVSTGRPLEAGRWEDGRMERIELKRAN